MRREAVAARQAIISDFRDDIRDIQRLNREHIKRRDEPEGIVGVRLLAKPEDQWEWPGKDPVPFHGAYILLKDGLDCARKLPLGNLS